MDLTSFNERYDGHPAGLVVIAGSKAYGLDHDDSDTDFKGFFVAPTEDLLGLHRPAESWSCSDPDISMHEVARFVDLALKAKPTVLDVLAIDPISSSPLAEDLRSNVGAFLSNRARSTFVSYAHGQLKQAIRPVEDPDAPEHRRRTAKHARHLLRAIQQGEHLLRSGELRVRVPNRDEILAFGDLPLDVMQKRAEAAIARFEKMKSVLPDAPDTERINEIVVRHRILGLA